MTNDYRKAHQNIHHWIRYNYGSASMCQIKGCTATKFTYALKKGRKHAKLIGNYIQLCQPHHKEYDSGVRHAMIAKKYIAKAKAGPKYKGGLTSVRITLHARNRLKVRAAQAGISFIAYIDQLVKRG